MTLLLAAAKADNRNELDAIWKAQIEKAKEGDAAAAKLIFESLDGKPSQQQHITGSLDATVFVEIIRNAANPPTS